MPNEKDQDKGQVSKEEQKKSDDTKIKVGDKELTIAEIAEMSEALEKAKSMEADFNKKLIDLSIAQKELEPVIQLQQFLAENPDKAAKIAEILEGKESAGEKKFETDIPEVKQLKEEIEELKKSISQTTSTLTYQQKVKEEQEFLSREMQKLSGKYEDLDEEVLFAKLMSINNLGQLSREKLSEVMDKIAKDLDTKAKERKQQYIQKYLLDKEKAEKDTRGEGKGGKAGEENPKIKGIEVRDGSAKKAAMEYLKKLGLKK